MDFLIQELAAGLPDARELARVTVRLVAAALVGAIAGVQREKVGKPAGLRTHMLVSLGSAIFVLVPLELGVSLGEVARVIQGVAAGIGFIGAGAILKIVETRDIEGLTTAAGLWLTAAAGVAIGAGGLGIAIVGMALTWIILAVLGRYEGKA